MPPKVVAPTKEAFIEQRFAHFTSFFEYIKRDADLFNELRSFSSDKADETIMMNYLQSILRYLYYMWNDVYDIATKIKGSRSSMVHPFPLNVKPLAFISKDIAENTPQMNYDKLKKIASDLEKENSKLETKVKKLKEKKAELTETLYEIDEEMKQLSKSRSIYKPAVVANYKRRRSGRSGGAKASASPPAA